MRCLVGVDTHTALGRAAERKRNEKKKKSKKAAANEGSIKTFAPRD